MAFFVEKRTASPVNGIVIGVKCHTSVSPVILNSRCTKNKKNISKFYRTIVKILLLDNKKEINFFIENLFTR